MSGKTKIVFLGCLLAIALVGAIVKFSVVEKAIAGPCDSSVEECAK